MLQPPGYRRLLRRLDLLERNLQALATAALSDGREVLPLRMLLRSRELRLFSQNGEDGILLLLFSEIGSTDRRFVEFGIQDGRECNCANLAINLGWSGLFIEWSADHVRSARDFFHGEHGLPPERVQIVEARVTAETINPILEEAHVTGEIDLLSIDIDSYDYWVWRAIEKITPRVVVIEYNASLGPDLELVVPYVDTPDVAEIDPRSLHHGASLRALWSLGATKGYALVGCDSNGVNAFFVRRDLLRGRLQEATPADGFYANSRRSRRTSPEEQLALATAMDFQTPPALSPGLEEQLP